MKKIKQKKSEKITTFLRRAVALKNEKDKDILVDFDNGIVLNTAKFKESKDLYKSLRNEYKSIIESLDNNHENVVENVEDSIVNSEVIDVIDNDNEEEIIENLPELSVANIDVTDETVIEAIDEEKIDLIGENIVETTEKLIEEEAEKDEIVIEPIVEDEILEEEKSKKELIELDFEDEFIEENFQEEEVEELKEAAITIDSIEALKVITSCALANSNVSRADNKEIINLKEKLENEKNNYEQLLEEKLDQYKDVVARRDAAAKFETMRMLEQNAYVDNSIKDLSMQKEEYNKILSEHEREKQLLEEALNELEGKLENSESFNKTVALADNLKLFDSKYYNLTDTLKLLHLSDSNFLEDIKKIRKLKWNVDAYQEYIDEIYTSDFIDETDEKIVELENERISQKDVISLLENYMLEVLPGSKIDENGEFSYDLEKDDPQLQEFRDYLASIETKIEEAHSHPIIIQNQILLMMQENAPKEEIESKVNILMSEFDKSFVDFSLNSDKDDIENINKRIEEISKELSTLKSAHASYDYINEDLVYIDKLKLEKLNKKQETIDKQIEKYDSAIYAKRDKEKIKEINAKINNYKKLRQDNINAKNMYILLNGEREDDLQIVRFNETITHCDNVLKDLEYLGKYFKLTNNKSKMLPLKVLKDRKENLILKREENTKNIQNLEKEIEDKKNSNGYEDVALKNENAIRITNLENELEELTNLRISLTKYSIKDLKNIVLSYDSNKDFELPVSKDDDYLEDNLTTNLSEDISLTETNEEEIIEENINVKIENESDNQEIEKENIEEENIEEEILDELEEVEEFKPAKFNLIEKIRQISFKKLAIAAVTTIVAGAIAISASMAAKIEKTKEDIKKQAVEYEQVIDNLDEIVVNKIKEIEEENKKNIEQQVEEEKDEENINVEQLEEDEVDTSRIAITAEDAAKGNFVPEEQINKKYFANDMVQSLNDFDTIDGKNIQTIVGHDGTIIGFTDIGSEENVKMR